MKTDQVVKIVSVSLSLFIAVTGGVAWLTAIQINGKENTESINDIKEKLSGVASDLSKVQTDVALIKQAVGAGKETASAGSTPDYR